MGHLGMRRRQCHDALAHQVVDEQEARRLDGLDRVEVLLGGCGTHGAPQTALTLAAHGCPGNRVEL